MSSAPERLVVIGVGNRARRDDAAGLVAAEQLAGRLHEGDATGLLDAWEGADLAIVIDAVRSGADPGTIHRLDASAAPLPARLRTSTSTHAIGVGEAIELARALGRLPRRVLVLGIEGRRFEAGVGLSREVAAAVDRVVESVEVRKGDGGWGERRSTRPFPGSPSRAARGPGGHQGP